MPPRCIAASTLLDDRRPPNTETRRLHQLMLASASAFSFRAGSRPFALPTVSRALQTLRKRRAGSLSSKASRAEQQSSAISSCPAAAARFGPAGPHLGEALEQRLDFRGQNPGAGFCPPPGHQAQTRSPLRQRLLEHGIPKPLFATRVVKDCLRARIATMRRRDFLSALVSAVHLLRHRRLQALPRTRYLLKTLVRPEGSLDCEAFSLSLSQAHSARWRAQRTRRPQPS